MSFLTAVITHSVNEFILSCSVIVTTTTMQARRKVFEIGAANSGEVGFGKGVNFTIIICADPVPGKKTA